MKWVTYSDQTPTQVTQLNAPKTTTLDGTVGSAIWAGGTYYNGYVYTVQQEQWVEENVIYNATGSLPHPGHQGRRSHQDHFR